MVPGVSFVTKSILSQPSVIRRFSDEAGTFEPPSACDGGLHFIRPLLSIAVSVIGIQPSFESLGSLLLILRVDWVSMLFGRKQIVLSGTSCRGILWAMNGIDGVKYYSDYTSCLRWGVNCEALIREISSHQSWDLSLGHGGNLHRNFHSH